MKVYSYNINIIIICTILSLFSLAVAPSIVCAGGIEQTWAWRTISQGRRLTDGAFMRWPEQPRDRLMLQELLRWSAAGDDGKVRYRFGYEIAGTWHGQTPASGEAVAGADPVGHPGAETLPNVWNTRGEFRRTARSLVAGTVERFQATWRAGSFDVDLGRQPVSLGTSHFVGILDVLAPFSPGHLDASFKPGIDALRLRTRSGSTGEAELIVVPARSEENRAVLGRLRRTLSGIDLEGIAGRFRQREMLGVGWEGEKRGWNLWGEVAVFSRRPETDRRRAGPRGYARSLIAGVERQIRPLTRVGLAGFYQDFGVDNPGELPALAGEAPFQEGWSYLGGRRYLLGTYDQEPHPLVRLNVSALVNAGDGSMLCQPKIIFNTGDNSDLTLFAWIGTGADLGTGPGDSRPRSEFGSAADGLGFLARRFF